MVLTRAIGYAGGVRAAFSGAVFLCRGFTGGVITSGKRWGLGRVGQCGSKVGGRLCGRFDNCSSGGSGS